MRDTSPSTTRGNDPHRAWAVQACARREEIVANVLDDEPALDTACKEIDALETMIARTPARTLAGVREQVMLAVKLGSERSSLDKTEILALTQALSALDRMLG